MPFQPGNKFGAHNSPKHKKVDAPSADELRERLKGLNDAQRIALLGRVAREKEARRTAWQCSNARCTGDPHISHPTRHARAEQRLPFKPGDGLLAVLYMAGRGWGKTRVGAEGVRTRVTKGLARRVGFIGRTVSDVRDVMLEGESGLLSCFPKWERPEYVPSKRLIRFHNGAIGTTYSSEEPDQLRGPQHDLIWGDEVSTWRKMLDVSIETGKPSPEGVLTNAFLGLRLGEDPRAILTGTPRPSRDMRYLVNMPTIKIVHGTTYDNLRNLAGVFKRVILDQYEGTRVGKQELLGELLKDIAGALLRWEHFEFDGFRIDDTSNDMAIITVNVDPAVTSGTKSDHTGISVTGASADRRKGYVLHSERFKGSPAEAMARVARIYDQFMGNYVVAETNNGGDYVATVMNQTRPDIIVKKVHASVGKVARAEPVAALYEQRRIMHIGHPMNHAALEDEWTSWTPDDDESPDVMDSVVWGLTNLMLAASARIVGKARSVRT